ncbi:MAG: hypothetical protein PF445_04095 [Melioribacteraceae bacterium]|jgi:hypothetical protein|nr:hypothetical protein [Melioribacteraceae bacterium]
MKLNKEKYTKCELGLTLVFFAYYLFLTFESFSSTQNVITIYFNVAVGYTIAVIFLVVILLLITKSSGIENDERDSLIEAKAYRNGFVSIVSIINILIIAVLFIDKIFEPFILFNILFSTLFLSHIVQSITQIFYYKKGI